MSHDQRSVAALQSALGSDYDIARSIGSGSTSTVYEAREHALDRSVAIKVLHPVLVEDESARTRFEQEAKAVAALDHPHVARAYRFGRLPDETPYLVMRLVKGRTMHDRLKAEGMLLPELALPVLRDVASALTAAHAIGIVHRDVRPANVLWDEENDKALLVDFGISTLFTTSGLELAVLNDERPLIGDPKCLSPEQIRDDEVTVRADIYAFGVMAYQLLTGQGPYDAASDRELLRAHLDDEPKDLMKACEELEPNIANVITRCLSKDPQQRPAASDISRAIDGVWRLPPLDGRSRELGAAIGKKRLTQMIAAGFVGAGFVAGGVATLSEQYEFMPSWAFTESLATGAAIVSVSAVTGWFHGEKGRQKAPVVEYVALSMIVVAWLVASLAIIALA